jgi:hypothetical protein
LATLRGDQMSSSGEASWIFLLQLGKHYRGKFARKYSWKDHAFTLAPKGVTGPGRQIQVQMHKLGSGAGTGMNDDLFVYFQIPATSGVTHTLRVTGELLIDPGGDRNPGDPMTGGAAPAHFR